MYMVVLILGQSLMVKILQLSCYIQKYPSIIMFCMKPLVTVSMETKKKKKKHKHKHKQKKNNWENELFVR